MEITKWEYELVSSERKEQMNELGKKGWEVVGVNDTGDAILKRPCGRLKVIEKVNGVEINSTDNEIDR